VNPRTSDGHPDLQGFYDIATLTPLERPALFGNNLTLTPQQAKRLEQQVADRKDQAARPSDGNRAAPLAATDRRARLAMSAATTISGLIAAASTSP
jgi:hypothetical protein